MGLLDSPHTELEKVIEEKELILKLKNRFQNHWHFDRKNPAKYNKIMWIRAVLSYIYDNFNTPDFQTENVADIFIQKVSVSLLSHTFFVHRKISLFEALNLSTEYHPEKTYFDASRLTRTCRKTFNFIENTFSRYTTLKEDVINRIQRQKIAPQKATDEKGENTTQPESKDYDDYKYPITVDLLRKALQEEITRLKNERETADHSLARLFCGCYDKAPLKIRLLAAFIKKLPSKNDLLAFRFFTDPVTFDFHDSISLFEALQMHRDWYGVGETRSLKNVLHAFEESTRQHNGKIHFHRHAFLYDCKQRLKTYNAPHAPTTA